MHKLVCVTWLDAADPDEGGWFSDAQIESFGSETVEVRSVGWVKSETKLYLTIAADRIENGDDSYTWGRPTKVPHSMIVKIEELTLPPSVVQTSQSNSAE